METQVLQMTPARSVDLYRFKYQLSYWTLFSWPRRLQVRSFGLEVASNHVESLASASDGLILSAVPLKPDVPTLSRVEYHGERLLQYVVQRFPRYYIEMSNTDFETYKAKFSGKTRSTFARKVRKFADHCGGQVRMERFETRQDLARFWTFAREVSAKTYQERLLGTGLPDDPDYLEQAGTWAANNALRAFLLFDHDRPVAYLFCPIRDGIVGYDFLGYDPDYQHLSVGTVLQWLALESLFSEGRYRFFDFTEGQSEQKALFATGHIECANVVLLKPTLTHQLLARSHHAFSRATEAFGRRLERLGFRTRFRQWLRYRTTTR